MKKITVFVLILSWFFFLPKSYSEPPVFSGGTMPNISLDFQDASLKDVLKVLSIQSGLNFIASEALQDRMLTIYLDNVPLDKTMEKLFQANNLTYELDQDANIFIVKDWGKPEAETVTQVFFLKYATVSSSSLKEEMGKNLQGSSSSKDSASSSSSDEGKWKKQDEVGITEAIKKLLSERGTVIEDFRTNSLIITDIPSKMSVISQVIASLDLPAPQALLEVEILDVSKNVVDKLGLNYGTSPFTAVLTGASAVVGFPFNSWKQITTDSVAGSLAVNTGSNTYTVALDFLRTQTDTKFLARPRILTLNNETAEIKIATSESIGLKQSTASSEGTATTTAEAERTDTGVVLRVTPQINPESGEITMFVYPKIAEAVAGNSFISGGNTYQFRDPEERSTKSVVRVKDGDTIVIGGLLRNELTRQEKRLPILSYIPIIGFLFRSSGGTTTAPDKNKQRELIVFITPRIIKDKAVTLARQEKSVKLPEREQNDAYGNVRELAINNKLYTFEKNR